MDTSFKLSRSNQIVIVLIALAYSWFYTTMTSRVPGGVSIFGLVFTLLVFALFPTFFAWIAWGIGGRSRRAANIVFHLSVVLILAALAWLFLTASDVHKQSLSREYERIMQRYDENGAAVIDRWLDAGEPIKEARMLDFAGLKDREEVELRKTQLIKFIMLTEEMKSYIDASRVALEKQVAPLGDENPSLKPLIAKSTADYEAQRKAYVPLIAASLEFARAQTAMIELLDGRRNEWTVESGQLSINDEKLQSEVNAAGERISKSAMEVVRTSKELTEVGRAQGKK